MTLEWNERKADPNDPLRLNTYTYVPNITAIMQSGNLYAYCIGNPLLYKDVSGNSLTLAFAGAGAAGSALSAGAVFGGANFWNPIGWTVLGVAAVTTVGYNVYQAAKNKPIGLPSWRKVTVDMPHIMSGHSSGGNRGPNKDQFPPGMTEATILKAIQEAYKHSEKIGDLQKSWQTGIEMVRQQFQGQWGDQVIQFWFNYTTKAIETAWPK